MSKSNGKTGANRQQKTKKVKPPPKVAICITCGEQSENHTGMAIQGKGLATEGLSIEKLREVQKKFEEMGGETEWLCCNDALTEEEAIDAEDAAVLILRGGVNMLLKHSPFWTVVKDRIEGTPAKALLEELKGLKWDTTYWDVRRQKWLNKRARYNICFGHQQRPLDLEKKSGTIASYHSVPLMTSCKSMIEVLFRVEDTEAEGNFYYDLAKAYIGFHGDTERKIVIAMSLCDEDVKREINWQWFQDSKPFGKRMRTYLYNGDIYAMSEKATGQDWKKRVRFVEKDGITTKIRSKSLRHAAGAPGAKVFKIKGYDDIKYLDELDWLRIHKFTVPMDVFLPDEEIKMGDTHYLHENSPIVAEWKGKLTTQRKHTLEIGVLVTAEQPDFRWHDPMTYGEHELDKRLDTSIHSDRLKELGLAGIYSMKELVRR